jgi:UDP-N-acetylmuramoyl-tripeptide--D-alanyl-D-alanine ligase
MIPMALSEISSILKGDLVLPAGVEDSHVISGFSDTDSRLIEPGWIFFAKPGEETDGHLFIPQASAAPGYWSLIVL